MDAKNHEIIVRVVPLGKDGVHYKTKIRIERDGKAEVREYIFPHACSTLDHTIIHQLAETIIEWGIDLL